MSLTTNRIGTTTAGARGRWLALAALVLSALVLGLDATILVTALPTLSAKLGATTSELQWILNAYTLALGGLLVPAGVAGDRFGRRRLLLIGLAVFGLASIVASQVTTAGALIAARAVMGAAGAIVMPLSLSILPSMFSEEERPRAIGIAAASAFLGLPLGPLVAGWLLTHFAWGSVFLINAPVVVLALAGVRAWVPESRADDAPGLDVLGAVLALLGVTALVYGIIQQPTSGWTDPTVIATIAGGAVLLAAFVGWELRAPTPLIDLRLFRDGRFTWSTVAFIVIGGAMFGVLFVISPFLQVVEGNDAQGTGVRLLPLIGAVLVGALASDRLVAWLGTRAMVPAGMAVTAIGLGLLSRIGADTPFDLVGGGMAVMGLGLGLAMPPALDAILTSLPASQTGAGTGLTRSLQQIAATLGVAILGSVLNTAYRASIDGHLGGLPAAAGDVVRGSVAGAAAVAQRLPAPLGRLLFQAARTAYVAGMADVLLVCAAVVLLGAALIAIFMPGRSAAEQPAAAGQTERRTA